MFGQMQDVPLLMNRILDHAMVNHSEREIVSRLVEVIFIAKLMQSCICAPVS